MSGQRGPVNPIGYPYTYQALDALEVPGGVPVNVSYPLVVYFESEEERDAFAREVRDAMKQRGRWKVGHLPRTPKGG